MTPATPLHPIQPTEHCELGPDGDFWSEHGPATMPQRREIARRNKAYPRLIEALRSADRRFQSFARNFSGDAALIALHDSEFCRALLRELGEE